MSRFRLQGKQIFLKGLTLDTEMSQRFAYDNHDHQTARTAATAAELTPITTPKPPTPALTASAAVSRSES
jgi:hypothetical protein